MAIIYSLADPRSGEIRYIGKADDADKRLKSHLSNAGRRKTPVQCWVRELKKLGLNPIMAVVAVVEDWEAREKKEIASRKGLLNLAPGGNQPRPDYNDKTYRNLKALGQLLRLGLVADSTIERMKTRPDVFGRLLAKVGAGSENG